MGRVVHFEIHAENLDRARNFYSTIFGWKFTSVGGPMEYTLIETGPEDEPGINGGMVKRIGQIDGQAVIAYVCTIDVPSLDEAVTMVEAGGGSIVLPKMPVTGIGWLAYGKDTEGNIFGMLQHDPSAA